MIHFVAGRKKHLDRAIADDFWRATTNSAKVKKVDIEAYRYEMQLCCGVGHGTAITMIEYGTTNDLPCLFAALKRIAPTNDAELVCTASHLLEAIEKITSAKPGTSFPAWEKWWKDTYGADIPVAKPTIDDAIPLKERKRWREILLDKD